MRRRARERQQREPERQRPREPGRDEEKGNGQVDVIPLDGSGTRGPVGARGGGVSGGERDSKEGLQGGGGRGGLTLSSSSGRSPPSLMPRFMATKRSRPGLSRTLGLWRLVFSMITAKDST